MALQNTTFQPIERLLSKRFKLISTIDQLRQEMVKAVAGDGVLNVEATADLYITPPLTIPSGLKAITFDLAGKFSFVVDTTTSNVGVFSFNPTTQVVMLNGGIKPKSGAPSINYVFTPTATNFQQRFIVDNFMLTNVVNLLDQNSPQTWYNLSVSNLFVASGFTELVGINVGLVSCQYDGVRGNHSVTLGSKATNNTFKGLSVDPTGYGTTNGFINSQFSNNNNLFINPYGHGTITISQGDWLIGDVNITRFHGSELTRTTFKSPVSSLAVNVKVFSGSSVGQGTRYEFIGSNQTTDQFPKQIGGMGTQTNYAYFLEADVVMLEASLTGSASFKIRASVINVSGNITITDQSTDYKYISSGSLIGANFSNAGFGSVRLNATGAVGVTCNWSYFLKAQEVGLFGF